MAGASKQVSLAAGADASTQLHNQPFGLDAPENSRPGTSPLGEENLLRDYLFLSEITRKVTSVGRDLAQATWARPGIEQSELVTQAGPAAASELALQKREHEARAQRNQLARGRGRGGMKAGIGGDALVSRVQARRDFLAKQARYLRIPLLLLPTGMEQAMKNRTGWVRRYVTPPFSGLLMMMVRPATAYLHVCMSARRWVLLTLFVSGDHTPSENRMEYTIQISPPGQSLLGNTDLLLMHHQPPERVILTLALDKLEQRSGVHASDWTSAIVGAKSRKRRRKGRTSSTPSQAALSQPLPRESGEPIKSSMDATPRTRVWEVSRPVLSSWLAGLSLGADKHRTQAEAQAQADRLIPFATCLPPVAEDRGKRPDGSVVGRGADMVCLSLSSLSKVVTLLCPLAKHALRNESTTKFIEWYQRQVAAGNVERFDPRQADTRQLHGADTRTAGLHGGGGAPVGPMLPASLLHSLAAQLGGGQPSPSTARDSGRGQADERAGHTTPRVGLRVPVQRSVQQTLQGIPAGWGVVEYPCVEAWLSEDLARAAGGRELDVLDWQRPADAAAEDTSGGSSSEDDDSVNPAGDAVVPGGAGGAGGAENAGDAVIAAPGMFAGLGLDAYASGSDDADEPAGPAGPAPTLTAYSLSDDDDAQ